jgi:hypothetical protein
VSLLLRILTSISRLVSPPVFTIDISRGTARVQHGDVPGGLVLEFSDVARAFDIRSGTIHGVRARHGIVLSFSGQIPSEAHQRLRNVLALHRHRIKGGGV